MQELRSEKQGMDAQAVLRPLIKILDTLLFAVLIIGYLLITVFLVILSIFRRRRPDAGKGVSQLCLSIVDLRESVVREFRSDVSLDGFIGRTVCFHLDFDKEKDESVDLGEGIVLYDISVYKNAGLKKIGLRRSNAAVIVIKLLFSLIKAGTKNNISVIRAQDPHLLGYNGFVVSRFLKVPYIIQICSNYEVKDRQAKGLTFRPFMFKPVERIFERSIMRQADLILTDRDNYKASGIIPADIPLEKYLNMGFFVDESHYGPISGRKDMKDELKITGKKVLLYVGRLCAVKFTMDLIDIIEECNRKRDDIVLVIAGSGPEKEEMQDEVKKRALSKNFMFLGKVPQELLKDLYFTADIVCFTSAGFTMIESALAARCIAAYDFEWHKEFIGENERGVLIGFRDKKCFADAVLRLLEDPRRRNELGSAARDFAIKAYSREAAIRKEIDGYKRVLGTRG